MAWTPVDSVQWGEEVVRWGVYLKVEVTGFTDSLDMGCGGGSEVQIWAGAASSWKDSN